MAADQYHSNQYGALGQRQSVLSTKMVKDAPAEEDSVNAKLLFRAGFVRKLMAGAYSFLPMGNRVLMKIEAIIRDEMCKIDSQEILMPALQPADPWKQTDRWDKMTDILFKFKGSGDRDMTLGPTHEEIVTPLMGGFINSYRDLPISVYQIQTKFRNEPRAKSGVLRGREFRMKDMYSFHATEADLDAYYERAKVAYSNIYERCGLGDITYLTYASGGAFSKYSHEYQMLAASGEDTIFVSDELNMAFNHEIIDEIDDPALKFDKSKLVEKKAIEVGNIFKLMTRFSDAFSLSFQDEAGKKQDKIYMGCYGIGSSRLVGAIVEASHDDKGMIWPVSVAPYHVHLISLAKTEDEEAKIDAVYEALQKQGIEVLYDDRKKVSPGVKFAESDLIGLPLRVVLGPKALEAGTAELKSRKAAEAKDVALKEFLANPRSFL